METDVKSRIIKFLKYKNISASQFSQQIGASRNYVSSMSNVQLVYPSQFVLGTINKMSPLIFSGLII